MSVKSSPKTIIRPEDNVGFWLNVLSLAIARSFEKALERDGVTTPQWVVLRVLYDRECSMNELAQAILLDHASTSRLVERLVQKKLVNREIPPEDRRSVRLSLTSAALDLVPKLASIAGGTDEAFFARISKTKKDQLLEIVMELIQKHEIKRMYPSLSKGDGKAS
jgi:DNA-binding MarR family transcriptional regulator